jgi:drug/metabolite transporter (DMT)-like permease
MALQRNHLALPALLLGAAALAFAPILVRLADVSPTASAFWRMALAAPLLWFWVWATERGATAKRRELPQRNGLLMLAGGFFAGDVGVWHFSILQTSIANATLELNLAPVFVVLGAWLLFGQRASRRFLFALVIAMAGAITVIGPHFEAGGRQLEGDAWGVLAGTFYAGYLLALKSATVTVSTARIMAVSTGVAAVVLLPYMLLTAPRVLPAGMAGWMVVAALALIPHVLGQSLVAFGFARLPASLSSLSLLLQPVMAALYAWTLFGESMSALQIAGAAIVLAGIYLARLSPLPEHPTNYRPETGE